MKILKRSKGFTLIELMVVIIIIGVLASISVPIYRQYVSRAIASEGQALVGAVSAAAKIYYVEHSNMPATYTVTAGNADTVLNMDTTQNKYFQGYTFTNSGTNAFVVSTTGLAGTDAATITVTLTQPASGGPTLTIVGM